jgi:hypothetical protein
MRVGDVLILILVILVLVLLLPIIIPFLIIDSIRTAFANRQFRAFLAANEKAKFFCYTARRTSVDYVKEHILPKLPADVNVIYLDDRKNAIVSIGDEVPFLVQLVASIKTKGGYPFAAKIVNGKMVSISVNNRLYSAIRRRAGADVINRRIARFLSNDDGRSEAVGSNPKFKI